MVWSFFFCIGLLKNIQCVLKTTQLSGKDVDRKTDPERSDGHTEIDNISYNPNAPVRHDRLNNNYLVKIDKQCFFRRFCEVLFCLYHRHHTPCMTWEPMYVYMIVSHKSILNFWSLNFSPVLSPFLPPPFPIVTNKTNTIFLVLRVPVTARKSKSLNFFQRAMYIISPRLA